MSVQNDGKLVRDKIPEIMEANGQRGSFRILREEEYRIKLDEKLKEELGEYFASDSWEEAARELADLSEVIDAVLSLNGISQEEFQAIKQRKREERGGFEKRLFLEKACPVGK